MIKLYIGFFLKYHDHLHLLVIHTYCNQIFRSISFYYEFSKDMDYICTMPEDNGMHTCSDLPPYRYGSVVCNETAKPYPSLNLPTNMSCVNWNQYYTNCTQRGSNPFQGTISFDNIGLAWVAIFLVRNFTYVAYTSCLHVFILFFYHKQ